MGAASFPAADSPSAAISAVESNMAQIPSGPVRWLRGRGRARPRARDHLGERRIRIRKLWRRHMHRPDVVGTQTSIAHRITPIDHLFRREVAEVAEPGAEMG